MKIFLNQTVRTWLCIPVVLLLAAMNCHATVLCIEADGSVTYEVTDAHGRCAPCPNSQEGGEQSSDSDDCVDIQLVSLSDIKMDDTATAFFETSSSQEGNGVLAFLSWLSASLQMVLNNTTEATFPYRDYQTFASNLYFARSVILLI